MAQPGTEKTMSTTGAPSSMNCPLKSSFPVEPDRTMAFKHSQQCDQDNVSKNRMPHQQEAKSTKSRQSSIVGWGTGVHSYCQTGIGNLVHNAHFYATTLLLFTGDQILDTVIPGTAFGILAALSGHILDMPAQQSLSVLIRIPQVSIWLWLVILQFCVQNQRSSGSIAEDSTNKPWRPIPAGRMTSAQADKLLMATHLVAGLLSYQLNVLPIFVVYVSLITAYNDYGGGNKSGVIRNLFCGAGFSCYFGGALSIAIGPDVAMSSAAWKWTATTTLGILTTTIQTQELRDEAGDNARGRRTLVTELGRKVALWTVFVSVAFWSVFIPLWFFHGNWMTAFLPVTLGAAMLLTAVRVYVEADNKLDRRLYKMWCLWMIGFCTLPLLACILG